MTTGEAFSQGIQSHVCVWVTFQRTVHHFYLSGRARERERDTREREEEKTVQPRKESTGKKTKNKHSEQDKKMYRQTEATDKETEGNRTQTFP